MVGAGAGDLVGVFLGSFSAMVKVFLTCAVGVFAALYPKGDPLLPDVALRNFSRLVTFLLIAPLIVYALGSSLTPELLLRYAILIPFGLSNQLFSYTFFRLLRPLHQEDEALRTASMIATMSPNIISMPLMMMQSLCDLHLVNDDYGSDSDECFTEATSMLFVYSIGFNFTYWAVLYPILSDLSDKINGTKDADEPAVTMSDATPSTVFCLSGGFIRKAKSTLWAVAFTPAMIGTYVGLFIGLVPGLRGLVFGPNLSPLTPLGGTIQVLASPVVCLNTLIMSASLAKVRIPNNVIQKYFGWLGFGHSKIEFTDSSENKKPTGITVLKKTNKLKRDIMSRMGIRRKRALTWTDMDQSAVVSGVEFVHTDSHGCVVDTEDEMGDDSLPSTSSGSTKQLNYAPVSSSNVSHAEISVMPAGEPMIMQEGYEVEKSATLVTPGTFLVHVLARLILPPIACILLLRLCVMGGIVGSNSKMIQLVIVLASANPSAQMVIVSLNQLGVPDLASQMSLLYVGQYLLCIVTLTMWASVGMSMIYV